MSKKNFLINHLEGRFGTLLPGELTYVEGLLELGGAEFNTSAHLSLRTIRASFIREIITSSEVTPLINTSFGFHVKNVYIDGKLNLVNQHIAFPIHIENSFFDSEIDLQYSKLQIVSFSGCEVQKIIATQSTVTGSLYLRNGFKCNSINLMGATVEGGIHMNNSLFLKDEKGKSFIADGITVDKGFFMENSTSHGEVRLLSAKIKNRLSFNGSIIKSETERSINGDSMIVNGSVSLNEGFLVSEKLIFMALKLKAILN